MEPDDAEARRMLDRTDEALARRARALADQAAHAARIERKAAVPDSARAPRHVAPAIGPRVTDREVEDLYRRGAAAIREQRVDDALRYWELVWSARPGYRGVGDFLKREYLARGMESFAAGRLDDAVSQWEHVLRVDPTDERAHGYLERARKQRERSREISGAD
jgi:tetratricopeptide (TPR) repeat protein